MKKSLLIAAALISILLSGCSNPFKEIKVTSYRIVSMTPMGLSALDVTVDLGVHNPAPQFTLSEIRGTLKMEAQPCLHISADDVTIQGHSDGTYTVKLHGSMDSGFNPFTLLKLLTDGKDMSVFTLDVSTKATLKGGLGKNLEYKDLKLSEFIGK